jgi:hypothetical protein
METEQAEGVAAGVVAPAPTGGALVRPTAAQSLQSATHHSTEELEAVARFLSVEASDPALLGLLALSKAYNLSPFLGEIILIDAQIKVRNADGKQEKKWIKRPAVGRDGFLSVAQKSGVHRGLQADVVCANDSFDVDWDVAAEVAPRVRHRHAPMGTGEDADPRRYRGPIIGAWAKVTRTDQLPFFYFAPLREHGKTWTSDDGRAGWSGAWTYTSAMIVKAAASYALRIAYSVTGVVPLDELRLDPTAGGMLLDAGPAPELSEPEDAVSELEGISPELRKRLAELVAAINVLDPSAPWTVSRIEMMWGGRSEAELEKVAEMLEGHHAQWLAQAEAQAGERAAADAEPVEAVVVEEDEEERVAREAREAFDALGGGE